MSSLEMPRIQQREDALQRAREVRVRRAELKRELRASTRDVTPLLLDPPAEIATMKVSELLLAVPKWGRVRVAKALRQRQISSIKSVGSLSERQRRDLAMVFTPYLRRSAAQIDTAEEPA